MPTETQKNFKRQMQQIEKEMSKKSQGEYFSYIENDHVESYYKPKNRKKVIAISLGSILPILWTGYAIYTWVKPLVINVNLKTPTITTNTVMDKGIFESKHMAIVNYLDNIEYNESKVDTYRKSLKHDFTIILNDQTAKTSYIETNTQLKKELETSILFLSGLDVPKEMVEYHATIKEKFDILLEQTVYSIDIAKSGNVNNIAKLQFIIEKINLLQKQQIKQMTSAFDKVGIKYSQEGDRITYWYNK